MEVVSRDGKSYINREGLQQFGGLFVIDIQLRGRSSPRRARFLLTNRTQIIHLQYNRSSGSINSRPHLRCHGIGDDCRSVRVYFQPSVRLLELLGVDVFLHLAFLLLLLLLLDDSGVGDAIQ